MAVKFLQNLDLCQNKLEHAVLPKGFEVDVDPVEGQLQLDSSGRVAVFNGTDWDGYAKASELDNVANQILPELENYVKANDIAYLTTAFKQGTEAFILLDDGRALGSETSGKEWSIYQGNASFKKLDLNGGALVNARLATEEDGVGQHTMSQMKRGELCLIPGTETPVIGIGTGSGTVDPVITDKTLAKYDFATNGRVDTINQSVQYLLQNTEFIIDAFSVSTDDEGEVVDSEILLVKDLKSSCDISAANLTATMEVKAPVLDLSSQDPDIVSGILAFDWDGDSITPENLVNGLYFDGNDLITKSDRDIIFYANSNENPTLVVSDISLNVDGTIACSGYIDCSGLSAYDKGAEVVYIGPGSSWVQNLSVNGALNVGDVFGTGWSVEGTIANFTAIETGSITADTMLIGDAAVATTAYVDEMYNKLLTNSDETVNSITELLALVEQNKNNLIKRFNYTITGTGNTSSFTVTHNLGTKNLVVNIFEANSPFQQVFADVKMTSTNALTVSFGAAVPNNTNYQVVVIG